MSEEKLPPQAIINLLKSTPPDPMDDYFEASLKERFAREAQREKMRTLTSLLESGDLIIDFTSSSKPNISWNKNPPKGVAKKLARMKQAYPSLSDMLEGAIKCPMFPHHWCEWTPNHPLQILVETWQQSGRPTLEWVADASTLMETYVIALDSLNHLSEDEHRDPKPSA